MLDISPSRTAYRVALRRAAHQVFDDPVVFCDPLALKILGITPENMRQSELKAPNRPWSRSMRAFLAARSLFAEEALAAAVGRGVTQYVLLGAGLDTFAYRNPHPGLRVFEVDHPATQAWKRGLLAANGIEVPATAVYVPVNFETDALADSLQAAGFDPSQPTLFAWLGVVPYLTEAAFLGTLRYLSAQAAGSGVVFDYGVPRAMLPPLEQLAFDSLAARVAEAGEPFRLFFAPAEIAATLQSQGFRVTEDMDAEAMNGRYFSSRKDGLRVLGSGPHLIMVLRP